MSETNSTKSGVFSFLYRNRVIVKKNDTVIANLSIAFGIISCLTAIWLVVGGFIAALALGYRFSFERRSPDFSGDLDAVVKGAANNVRSAVNSVASSVGIKDEDDDGRYEE